MQKPRRRSRPWVAQLLPSHVPLMMVAGWLVGLSACVEAEEFFKEIELEADVQPPTEQNSPPEPSAESPAPSPPGQATRDPRVLDLERGSSSITGFLQKATQGHEIEFGVFTGALTMRGDAPEKIEVVVHTPSLHADHPALEHDIKSARVLRALRFPRAKFTSSAIKARKKPGSQRRPTAARHYIVEGQLTIRGTSQLIRFPAILETKSGLQIARAQVPVDLARHGLHDARADNELVERTLTLDMQLAFAKRAQPVGKP